MSGYVAEFEAPDGTTATVGSDAIVGPDVPDEHSVINEFEFGVVPDSPQLEMFRHGSVALHFESDAGQRRLIQAGPVDAVNSSATDGRTTIRAKDDLERLTNSGPDGKIVADGEAADEIERVWSLTPFDATVTKPDPRPVSDGRVIQDDGGDLTQVFSVPETLPISVSSSEIRPQQTAWFYEANGSTTADRYSGGEAFFMGGVGFDTQQITFTPQHRIPNEHVQFALRGEQSDGGLAVKFFLDSTGVTTASSPPTDLDWADYSQDFDFDADLEPGTQYTLRVEATNDFSDDGVTPDAIIDLFGVYDARYPPTFDNQVHEPGGFLDGPEEIPAAVQAVADVVSVANSITAAELTVSSDTGGQQSLGLEFGPDTSTAFDPDLTTSNTTTLSGDNPGDLDSSIQAAVTLGHTDAVRDTQTPRTGFEAQMLTSWELAVDEVSIIVFNAREFSGNWYQILQEMHDEGGLIFRTVPTEGDTYRAETFEKGALAGDPVEWTRLGYERGYESTTEYANRLVAVGGEPSDGGARPTTTVEDTDEIDRVGGVVPAYRVFESRTSEADLINRAQAELRSLTSDQLGGTVDIVPRRLAVGMRYQVPAFDDEEVVLERLRFSDGRSPTGTLEFSERRDVSSAIAGVRREVRSGDR